VTDSIPASIARVRPVVDEALRAAVKELDPHMALIASYQMGWCEADGAPAAHAGKGIRPTLAALSGEAVGATVQQVAPAAAAVELVHNFSLLHDDVMDGDLERRHRPTGWAVFGQSQAILAGSAMLTAAVGLLSDRRAVQCLLEATQRLIAGQSADLRLEAAEHPQLSECLDMEAGKTAALLACSTSIGALAGGGAPETVAALELFGHEVGMAFQLVDDVLGITGPAAVTGKSSSDIRSGKRSAPVVAALNAGGPESQALARALSRGLPRDEEEVAARTELVLAAGGVDWTVAEAARRLQTALHQLGEADIAPGPRAELRALAEYVVQRTS
jgi:geranylgeranyl diphosphate synthase type I